MKSIPLYYRKAKILSVHSGSSVVLNMDLGHGIRQSQVLRLADIETADLASPHKEERVIARRQRDHLQKLLRGKGFIVHSRRTTKLEVKRGGRGPYVVTIYRIKSEDTVAGTVTPETPSINERMVREAKAIRYSGGWRQPWV